MTTVTFDKLTYVDGLKAAGIPEPQARAMAEGLDKALRDEIVTKPELKAQLADLRAELKADIANSVSSAKMQMIMWVIGVGIAQIGILKYIIH